MKILIVNTNDIHGGAARAANRLHQALLKEGLESQMLVQAKFSDDHTVLRPKSKVQRGIAKFRPALDNSFVKLYKNRSQTLFSPAWLPSFGLVNRINALKPDIVHLHWICDGMLRIEDIPKINAPIVWSLHDNWAFTGGCHIMWECTHYKRNCGSCPRLGSTKQFDLSRIIFNKKMKSYSKLNNLTIIGLSRWLANCASESSLFKNNNIFNLPNLIDTNAFSPIKQSIARKLLYLPLNKKLVLFGAMDAVSDVNKGYSKLCAALANLKRNDIELVVFGSSRPKESQNFKFPTHYLGHLHDNVSLRLLYSAADVMVVPSLQEAFGQTACEPMACGTPVVAFAHTGLLDIIDHQINGYLAQPFDVADLAKGIEWILNSPDYEVLSKNARNKIMREFDSKIVVKKYISLYHSILNKDRPFSVTQA